MAQEIVPVTYDVVELAVIGEFDEGPDVVNVMEYQIVTAGIPDIAAWIVEATALVNMLLGVWDGIATAHTVWSKYRVRNKTTGSPSMQIDLPTPVAGTVAGDSLPAGVSLMLGFHTPKPGSVLRKFLGVPGETMCDADGAWTTATLTGAATAVSTMLSPFITPTVTFYYGKWDDVSMQFNIPFSGYIASEPAYQRRRRRGTGS